jgi:hypothetical protein
LVEQCLPASHARQWNILHSRTPYMLNEIYLYFLGFAERNSKFAFS